MKVSRPTAIPDDLFPSLREGMLKIFRENTLNRQIGVVLCDLVSEEKQQYSLFDDTVRIEKMSKLYQAVDALSEKFGKHTLQSNASLPTKLQVQHEGARGDVAVRKTTAMLKGENSLQRLGMPVLHLKV